MNRTLTARLTGLTLSAAVFLTGCAAWGADNYSDTAVDAEEMNLSDAVAAFTVSRQSAGFRDSGGNGYLSLVTKDGEIRSFQTAGMDNAQIDWSPQGLVFSDTENDYHLSDRLETSESPKTNYQQAMFATSDRGSIGVYNDGFTDDGYVNQLVSTKPGSAELTEVEGNYQVTGMCDGEVYGLAEPSGTYARRAESKGLSLMGDYELRSQMLNRLTPGDDEHPVALRGITESGQYATDAPCQDGTLHHLATAYDDQGQQSLVLRSWDVRSGEVDERDISNIDDTTAVPASDHGFEMNGYTHHSVRGGHLDWVSSDRRVMSTELSTGKTRELFRLADGDIPDHAAPGSVHFTRDTLTTLTEHPDTGHGLLITWDRSTGNQKSRIELPSLSDAVEEGYVLRDIAVRPE